MQNMAKYTMFLKTLIISLIVFDLFQAALSESNCDIKSSKIIVVGSGPSGIAAASKLFENGFTNVKVLEAENRIGGRVYSTKFGEYMVDMGGQWVHGRGDNVAYKMAEPLGLLESTNESDFGQHQIMMDSQGSEIREDVMKNLTDFFFEYAFLQTKLVETNYSSVGAFVENMFEEKYKNVPEIYNGKGKYLMYLELALLGSVSSESWHDISISPNDRYVEYPGDLITNWKNRTYSTILDIMMKRYPDPKQELPVMANTHLNSEVSSIDYTKKDGKSKVVVTTSSGEKHEADHVIVTVSLGVLKATHNSLFVPPLPEYKVKTIEGLGFGFAGKVYLFFDEPFWMPNDAKMLFFTFIWDENDKKLVENDPEKMWTLGVNAVYAVEHKPNLLEVWISGKYAKAMEVLPENKVLDHSVELLNRFLGKKYNVTQPKAILRTQWFTNPHFRGVYSYRSMKTLENNVDADMLEKPLEPENLTVMFAGEATSSERYATVDGAIGSGWKAANKLTDYYSKNCKTE